VAKEEASASDSAADAHGAWTWKEPRLVDVEHLTRRAPFRGEHKESGGYVGGYQAMCEFFSIHVYDQLHCLGYEYYLRLDDDGNMLPETKLDLFRFSGRAVVGG
jgi:hypothetical protein